MYVPKCVLLLSAVLSFSPQLYAGIRPSFNLDSCAWEATDIVIATEGEQIDGTLTVVSVLHGELAVGDSITVPGLSDFANKESRTVNVLWTGNTDEKTQPLVLSSDCMILFLKRNGVAAVSDKSSATSKWQPASIFGGMQVSVAWITNGRVYAFTQVINPGPSILVEQECSEKIMKTRIGSVVESRKDLLAISKLTNTTRKAADALKYTSSQVYHARAAAFKILTECGNDALPALRDILNDKTKSSLHVDAVNALVIAGGESIVPELIAMVQRELAFWKKTAPTLKEGWWNGKEGLEWNEVESLRNRYCVVLCALSALGKHNSALCRDVVQDFRDYWRSLPQLEGELHQMSDACDAVLSKLSK